MSPKFKNEKQFHSFFYECVKQDFYTVHEVPGACFINHPCLESASVRADFLLFPRQHLIDAGFVKTWFAAELKMRRSEEGYRQAFWYPLSEFVVKGRKITPSFAVVCLPEKSKECAAVYSPAVIQGSEWFEKGVDSAMARFNLGRMNVAVSSYARWAISFGMDCYAKRYPQNDQFDGELMVDQSRKNFWIKVGSNPSVNTHDAGRDTA